MYLVGERRENYYQDRPAHHSSHLLVTLMDQLVSPADELQVVVGEELCGHLGSEQPASTTGRNGPALHLLWVRPDQVTESSLVRNLLVSLNQPDLVQAPDLGRQAPVDTEDLAVDEGCDCEKIKDFATRTQE